MFCHIILSGKAETLRRFYEYLSFKARSSMVRPKTQAIDLFVIIAFFVANKHIIVCV